MKILKGKRAIVTGGSGGFGKEISLELARRGAKVLMGYSKNQSAAVSLQNAIKKIGGESHILQVHLEKKESINKFIAEASNILSGIDIFINNAGITTIQSKFEDISPHSCHYVFNVNFFAPFMCTQLVAPLMSGQKNGGIIINISSMSTRFMSSGAVHYQCSKAALDSLTKGTALAFADKNVRINGIAPGSIATDINKRQREDDPEEWLRRQGSVPLRRPGRPKDIADACVFLCSDEASWITGTTLIVDGGAHLMNPFTKNKFSHDKGVNL